MNPDWLEDCAEGRDIFFSLLLLVAINRAMMSVALVLGKVRATPQNEKLGKVWKIIQKVGDVFQSYIFQIPTYFSGMGYYKY